MFIVFEGIDSSGKRTQTELCTKYLKSKGREVSVYNYPNRIGVYSTVIDNFLRKDIELTPTSQFLTFLSDIANDNNKILRDRGKGMAVIADRYIFSSIAYQRIPIERAVNTIEALNFVRPDIVFFLDVSPEIAMSRKKRKIGSYTPRESKYEKHAERLLLARIKYQTLAERNFLSNWVTINGSESPDKVFEEIKKNLEKL